MKKIKLFLSRHVSEKHITIGGGKSIKSVRLSVKTQVFGILLLCLIVGFVGKLSLFYVNFSGQMQQARKTTELAEMQYRALLSEITVYKDHLAKISADLDQNQTQITAMLEGTTPPDAPSSSKGTTTVFGRLSGLKQGILSLAFHREAEDISASQERERIRLFSDQERIKNEIAYLDGNLSAKAKYGASRESLEKADMNIKKAILQRDLALSQTKTLFERVKDLELLVEEMQNAHFMTLERISQLADGRKEKLDAKLSEVIGRLSHNEKEFTRILSGIRKDNEKKHGMGGPFIPISEELDGIGLKQKELNNKLRETHKKLDGLEDYSMLYEILPLGQPTHNYRVSCAYGPRLDPFNRGRSMHDGIDLATRAGTPVHATGPGVVTFAGSAGSYGLMVEITHGMGIKSRFAHLQSFSIKKGDRILAGQQIGKVGSTGRSTGPHLHYELRIGNKTTNPTYFMKVARNAGKNS